MLQEEAEPKKMRGFQDQMQPRTARYSGRYQRRHVDPCVCVLPGRLCSLSAAVRVHNAYCIVTDRRQPFVLGGVVDMQGG